MILPFSKYHGAGNDFILIDDRKQVFPTTELQSSISSESRSSVSSHSSQQLIGLLCHRRFGIGADGLILVRNSELADFEMQYFNADGNSGSLCGNGGRCVFRFAASLGLVKEAGRFITSDGIHHAEFTAKGDIKLGMADVSVIKKDGEAWVIDTGSPHYVSFRTKIKALDVYKEGMSIRHNAVYDKEGINVNFVEEENQGLFVRTFERGVEAETLACGTGVTACAIAFAHKGGFHGHTKIDTRAVGGNLSVEFYADHGHFSKVHLIGPAEKVFSGEINIPQLTAQYILRQNISEK